MSILIYQIDYEDSQQAADLIRLLDHYAQGEMGGGKPLSEPVKQTLVSNLAKLPNAIGLIPS